AHSATRLLRGREERRRRDESYVFQKEPSSHIASASVSVYILKRAATSAKPTVELTPRPRSRLNERRHTVRKGTPTLRPRSKTSMRVGPCCFSLGEPS